jgi:hypothetical protein
MTIGGGVVKRGRTKSSYLYPVRGGELPLCTELPRETVRKGSRVASGASISALRAAKEGSFEPFRRLLRLQFGADQGFSDNFRETIWKIARRV